MVDREGGSPSRAMILGKISQRLFEPDLSAELWSVNYTTKFIPNWGDGSGLSLSFASQSLGRGGIGIYKPSGASCFQAQRQRKRQSLERVTGVNTETKSHRSQGKEGHTKMEKWTREDLSNAGQCLLRSWSEMLDPLAQGCSIAFSAISGTYQNLVLWESHRDSNSVKM